MEIVLFQVLTDPERAAKRKIKKQLKKREVKKKRIEKIKGPKFSTKKRKEFQVEDI
jgi:U3 small nucleolar RNA-associated protein 20